MDWTLYPDVARLPSLRAALQVEFDRAGHDLTARVPGSPGWRRVGADVRKGDRGVDIVMGIEKRVFIMQFWAQDVMLTKGSTAEMRAVAGAAHVWLTGATVRQLNATWPFVKCSDWAEAVERGEATEFRWRRYLTDPLPPHMVELGPFIVAAAREPRLRALYPFTSHLTLRFRPTIQPVDAFDLCVIPLGDGIYRVVVPARREMGTGDASTSVRLALTMLHD